MKKILSLLLICTFLVSFTAFAAADVVCMGTSIDGVSKVYAKEGIISLTFNAEIDENSIDGITITENTVALAGIKINPEPEHQNDYKSYAFGIKLKDDNTKVVEILFVNNLKYRAEYVIDYSALKDLSGTDVSGTTSITFTVEDEPIITIKNLKAVKRDSNRFPEATDGITPEDGSLYGWTMDIKNNAETETDITVALALYDSNGMLKDLTTTIKKISAGDTVSISMSTEIPVSTDSGVNYSELDKKGKVKLYFWNEFSDKSPLIGAETFDIQ